MMKGRWRRHRHHEVAEMNITAFMNLMVILVPFLLITAVFSRIAILELTLPNPDAKGDGQDQQLQLEVIVRADRLEVADRGAAAVVIPKTGAGHDVARLSKVLKEVKALVPDKTDVAILLEPDIPYDELIRIMDAVRVAQVVVAGSVVQAELFPDISIGDAPPATTSGGRAS